MPKGTAQSRLPPERRGLPVEFGRAYWTFMSINSTQGRIAILPNIDLDILPIACLKAIEVYYENVAEGIEPIFEPIKATFEGYFTAAFTEQIQPNVLQMELPNLRLRGINYIYEESSDLSWLDSPMLQNLRTMVIFHSVTETCVEGSSGTSRIQNLSRRIKIRYIFFVGGSDRKMGPKKAKAFESHGVQCYILFYLP
ncbi:uncharacterized protein MELLADRAFT_59038 [Melampsora larici-populina 98AG31]|uniref:Uncharacterized protein n=1 Tax=Melampsora larici-populina (strain 98AG31 / pathotype 3-4-7) TaxID=747676 RepID=F4R6U4_MELLP|nr:uncharacterized protein MELLADRAFT_59038 [Melampsora larici-populina 98AG31]EGG12394.1 hypothetical protein MELLADRAFT_59038 [Melampsora larici-populina 98AG31]